MKKIEIKQTISFSQFDEQQVRRMFGLTQEIKENLLADWEIEAKKTIIETEEQVILERLNKKLQLFVRGWNEEELKIKFIGPLIELVDFDNYDLEVVSFSERPLKYQFQENIEIKGMVDLMVARGISQPEQPFFFIHEYKREQMGSGDPVGQLLATMFVANELNKEPKPFTLFEDKLKNLDNSILDGVYVLGRFWFFTRLQEQKYYISKSYDSLEREDLQHIFKMLKAKKRMILKAF
ncbi:MAG: hypothetical protein AB8G11_12435 [Saprospiraceae bacterium]